VRESNFDKTLNDAFGDDDEPQQDKEPRASVDNTKTKELKDKLKEIGVNVNNEPKEQKLEKPENTKKIDTSKIDKKVAALKEIKGLDDDDDDDDDDDMMYMP
jgi:hypothetical protein